MSTIRSAKKRQRKAAAQRGDSKASGWGTTAFALCFVAVGAAVLLFGLLPHLFDWARMQRWQAVPATLVSASLDTSRSSKSTTYGVSASYRYQVAGHTYQGQRVAISGGRDNIGDFQQALGHRLVSAYREGSTVPAWVNPDNPHEAVLDRSLRPGLQVFKLVFVVAFGGVGCGMLYVLSRGRRAARARADPVHSLAGSATATAPQSRPPEPSPSAAPAHATRAAAEAACQLQRTDGGVRLYLPAGRAWKQTLPWMGVGGVFLALVALFGYDMPLGLAVVMGALGGITVLMGVYTLANSLTVQLDRRGIRTERRLCGLMLIHHQAPAHDILRLREAVSYTVQTGSRQETFYRLEAELRLGKKLTIADNLRGRQAAEALLSAICAQTGYAR
jgi:hypothetical protein